MAAPCNPAPTTRLQYAPAKWACTCHYLVHINLWSLAAVLMPGADLCQFCRGDAGFNVSNSTNFSTMLQLNDRWVSRRRGTE
jgi:hypothetical protein